MASRLWQSQIRGGLLRRMIVVLAGTAAIVAVAAPGALAAAPTLSIDPVAKAELPLTKLTGTVDPGERSVLVLAQFRIVGAGEEWHSGTVQEAEAEAGPTAVAVEAGPLAASTKYEARLAAEYAGAGFVTSLGPNPTFTTESVGAPTVTMEAPTAATPHSVHLEGHINPDAPVGEHPGYDLTWRFVCTPECGSSGGQIAADSTSHLVEEEVTGLSPGTTYLVALQATNSAGSVESTPTLEFVAPAAPPTVEALAIRSITTDRATLSGEVNPGGATTTYHFDYLPSTSFEAEGWASPALASTLEEGPLPADNADHSATATLTNLTPGTRYVWRIVASNSAGVTDNDEAAFATQAASVLPPGGCGNEAFRQFAGTWLPDCRAYEQVSPTNKNGVGVEGLQDLLGSSPLGSSVSFFNSAYSGTPESGEAGHQEVASELSSFVDGAWTTRRLLPPESFGEHAYYLGATADQRFAAVEAGSVVPGTNGTLTSRGLYLIDTIDGSISTVVTPTNMTVERFAFAGASSNDEEIFFETANPVATTPEGAAAHSNLYMWNRASGQISLAGVLPTAEGGDAPQEGSFGGAFGWFEFNEINHGGAMYGQYVEANHAIAEDGSKVYFTTPVTAEGSGQLYLRQGLDTASPSTVRVSAPEPGVIDEWVEEAGEGDFPAAFQEATPNGEYAFFLSGQHLTTDATTGRFDEGKDIYRYNARTQSLLDITPDPAEESSNGARVRGLLGVSADGSSGYFVARGVLPVQRLANPEGPEAGAENLYRFFASEGQIKYDFVTRLAGSDRRNWSPGSFLETGEPGHGGSKAKTSRVTPNGLVVLFSSRREPGGAEGVQNFYRYSASENSLGCISCNPTGEPGNSNAELSVEILNTELLPTGIVKSLVSRNLSADGSRVFFNTASPLVAGDTNGANGCPFYNEGELFAPRCEDAYEWEAPGAPGGTCHAAEVNGGCLYLLSTGISTEPSYFLDASSNGSDVFIATDSRLVPTDKDGLFDIYDARENGGLAAQYQEPAPQCVGESCRGAATVPGPSGGVATSSSQAAGNVMPPKRKACGKNSHKCKKKKKNRKTTQKKLQKKKHGQKTNGSNKQKHDKGDRK